MANKSLDIIINVTDKATKQLQRVSSDIDGRAKRNEKTFQNMAVAGGAVFAGISYGATKAISAYSDFEESVNAVSVVFGDATNMIEEFGKESAKTVGLSKRQFNELSTVVGASLQNYGFSAEEASAETIELTKRASDMASVFNTDVETAMQAIQAGLRGQADPIEKFGVGLSMAQVKAYALREGIIEVDRELTDQEKTLSRLGLMYEQTDRLQGDFANTSDSLSNSQKIIKAQFENTIATRGSGFIPVLEQVQQRLIPILDKISIWIEKNPELTANIIMVIGAVSGLILVFGTLGMALPGIITAIQAVGTALVFLASNPIVLLVVAIGVLTAYIVTHRDEIKAKTIEIFDYVSTYLLEKRESIGLGGQLFVRSLVALFTLGMSEVALIVYNNRDLIKKTIANATEQIKGVVVGFVDAINRIWSDGRNTVVAVTQGVGDSISSIFAGAFENVKAFANNAINHAIKKLNDLIERINNVTGKVGISVGTVKPVGQRAMGGPVTSNTPYLVGEKGPELFVPNNSGSIVPNGAGKTVNINLGNVNINNAQDENRLVSKIKQAMVEEYKDFNMGVYA